MKYRKKPVVIDAVQWTATKASWDQILELGIRDWEPGEMGSETFSISTLDGKMKVQKGDFVIKGTRGEFYPCKPGPFADTFEPVNSAATNALLIVEAGVRYWEDATINGVEDERGDLVPFRVGFLWKPVIDLATGAIKDWPKGTTARFHYKVCDAGQYWIADSSGRRRAKWKGDYVPNDLLCVGDEGYGDYIIFNVGADGIIEGWKEPEIDEDEWEKCP